MKTSKINQEIGNRIKLARISMNLSQDSVAEDLGISVSAYSNMERGTVDITVSRVVKVADILKTNWVILLGINQNSTQQNITPLNVFESEIINQKLNIKNFFEIIKEIDVLKQEMQKLKKTKSKKIF
jgi:transcriptional regulator with XRE-family HTH domain